MSLTAVRKTVIGIVNEVERRLGVDASLTLTDRKLTTVLLDLLNDVIDEVSDFADWQEMFREATVTAQSSVGTYEVAVSSQVKDIYEIVWDNQVAPLEVRSVEDLRRLQRLASYGTPRQFAVVGVSGVNPLFRVYPVPTTAATFDIAYYKKPGLFATTDVSAVPSFPSRVLVQGLYAKALLEENGGEETNEFRVAQAEYLRMRQEAANRFTSDTGTSIQIVPTGSRYG